MWLVLVCDINFSYCRSEIKLSYLVFFFQAANVGFGRVFALVSDSWLGNKSLHFYVKIRQYSNVMVAGKARCREASDWYHCFVDSFNN